jgi:phosphoribosylamine--glycine ligase
MNETVLIVGSGAREHAIAVALKKSASKVDVVCFGSTHNPGIASLCTAYITGETTDAKVIATFATKSAATLAIVGPEAPLAAGVADALWAADIPTVGPTASLARIESSKGFTRELLTKYGIPGNPEFQRFETMTGVDVWLTRFSQRHVIKDDGLAGGKGVKVFGDHLHSHEESLAYCEELHAAGRPFVLEEKLEGEEFSLLSFSDGVALKHMPPVQDHKRAYEGDTGPNTGGMGTYTDANGTLPFLHEADIAAAQAINERVIAALASECGEPYRGILYGGFMATADGVRLIEYNARFGDPEALNLLTLLTSDFAAICRAIVDGNLAACDVQFGKQASVCKYLVPEGYPDAPRKGDRLTLSQANDVDIYLGSVDERNGQLVGAGSRAVGVVGLGATLADAEAKCQRYLDSFEGPFFFRRDIGTADAVARRIQHMEALRSR